MECMKEFREHVLEVHNKYRSEHSAKILVQDTKLDQTAQQWADYLAEKDIFEHSEGGDYGENLYAEYTSHKLKASMCQRNFLCFVLSSY